MKLFSYTAMNEEGKKITGIYRADTEEEVLEFLQDKNLSPISISVYEKTNVKKKGKKKHRRVKLDDYLFFARQMSVMLEAGVPLLRVLDVVSNETSSIKLAKSLHSIKDAVSSGWSLEKAIAKHPDVFDKFWVNLIKTGEATGQLGFVLKRLGDHMERQASFSRKIQSALVYPAILLIMTIAAVIFLSVFIIPKFQQLFDGFGQDLPALTKAVLAFSNFLQHNFVGVIIGLIVLGVLLKMFFSSSVGKSIGDLLVLELPGVKAFTRTAIMEVIAANMALLSESGVPILNALDIVSESSKNSIVAGYLKSVRKKVRDGVPIAVAMDTIDFFDSILVQMISVGEEVGDLAEMLNKVAKYYEDEMDAMLVKFTSMFEPIMLVVMAGVIGVLVAAIFLPIFKLANLGG